MAGISGGIGGEDLDLAGWWKRDFWERWGFVMLLKLQSVGSRKLCLCIGPILLAAFCQNSHLFVLKEVATHSVILLLLVCSKWLLAQT